MTALFTRTRFFRPLSVSSSQLCVVEGPLWAPPHVFTRAGRDGSKERRLLPVLMLCLFAGAAGISCQRDVPPAPASSQQTTVPNYTATTVPTALAGNPLESRNPSVPLNYLFM